ATPLPGVGVASQQSRNLGALDRRSAALQARQQDAGPAAERSRPRRFAGLSGKPELMTTTDYQRRPTAAIETPALRERLAALWQTAPGFYGFLATVDHKQIGIRYIITAFAFLIAGGVEALIFRLQLSWSNLHLLTPEQYDQLFTMHGMTMIF